MLLLENTVFLLFIKPHRVGADFNDHMSDNKANYRSIITLEPGKRSGQPCIRGLRITVYDVLSYLAAGMSIPEILEDFPMLTQEDIMACLAYAADAERIRLVA